MGLIPQYIMSTKNKSNIKGESATDVVQKIQNLMKQRGAVETDTQSANSEFDFSKIHLHIGIP